jgi:multiple sugar transport system substrate-binding protein
MRFHRLTRVMLVLLLSATATGCFQKPEVEEKDVVLKVVGDGDERSFYATFAEDYVLEHPHVSFDFTGFQNMAPDQTPEQFMETVNPDLVVAQRVTYPRFANNGTLASLDALIQRDDYVIGTIAPAVIDLLRSNDTGELFGLPPYFQNTVLFYNVDLFRKHNIAPPVNGMTWDEVIRLAAGTELRSLLQACYRCRPQAAWRTRCRDI